MIKDKTKYLIGIVAIIIIIVVYGFKNIFSQTDKYERFTFNNIIQNSVNRDISNELNDNLIKVHITGEVNNPGLIELEAGSRIYDAIEFAGGLTNEADTSKTNLAYILSDGEKIYIPSFNDEENNEFISDISSIRKININTANIQELESIPGVGSSTATAILEYRNDNGKFFAIEDIQNVSGIGESKFEKMKEYITVK